MNQALILMFMNMIMTQNTPQGYVRAILSDVVLYQITWHPQTPSLIPTEMFWVKLDHSLNEKQSQNLW